MTSKLCKSVVLFWVLVGTSGCGTRGQTRAEFAGQEPAPAAKATSNESVARASQGLAAAPPAQEPSPTSLGSDFAPKPAVAPPGSPTPATAGAPGAPPPQGPPAAEPAPPPPQAAVAVAPSTDAGDPKPPPAGSMLDIEARLRLEVESVNPALIRIRSTVQQSGGYVIEERLREQNGQPLAELVLRVPARSAAGLLDALGSLGRVSERQVTVKDVGKEYYDATLRLNNLEILRRRYEDLASRAHSVEDLLRIEEALDRVRERIEVLKGQLRWLQDRTAQATLRVTLVGPDSPEEAVVHPETKLYPGLRLTYLADFWRATGNAGYLGAGVSLRASRHFSVDIDGLKDTSSGGRGLDYLLLTLGGELYSDYLGAGQRPWINPYIGFRGGYARCLGRNEVALGGSLGLELYKSQAVVVDLESRVYGVFGTNQGAHLAVQPGAGVYVAF